MARQYQRNQHLLNRINEMLASGMTQKEVADELGLADYRPVRELLKRKPKGRLHICPMTTTEAYERIQNKTGVAQLVKKDFFDKLLRFSNFQRRFEKRLLLNAKGNPDGFLSRYPSLRNLRLGGFFDSLCSGITNATPLRIN